MTPKIDNSCRSLHDKLLFIVDIDGSLVPYYYDDEDLLKDQARLDDVLSRAKPFSQIADLDFVVPGNRIVFITGRKTRQKKMTESWITKHFHVKNPNVIFVDYKNKEQYINDKMKYIRDAIEEAFCDCENPSEEVVIIEDDTDVIDEIMKQTFDFKFTIYKVDRKTGNYDVITI